MRGSGAAERTQFCEEAGTDGVGKVGDGYGRAAFQFDAGHGDAVETAGDDCVKSGEISADVDGETVHGNPSPDADADGSEFPFFHPDAGEAVPG